MDLLAVALVAFVILVARTIRQSGQGAMMSLRCVARRKCCHIDAQMVSLRTKACLYTHVAKIGHAL